MAFEKVSKNQVILGSWNEAAGEFELSTDAVMFIENSDKLYKVKRATFTTLGDGVKLVTVIDDSEYAELVPE